MCEIRYHYVTYAVSCLRFTYRLPVEGSSTHVRARFINPFIQVTWHWEE